MPSRQSDGFFIQFNVHIGCFIGIIKLVKLMNRQKLSVKEIVQFIYASGDLSNKSNVRLRQLEGQRIHLKHQESYNNQSKKEVFVETYFKYGDIEYYISGRIDGVLIEDDSRILEEIKSTETALSLIDESTYPSHMNQLKMYAYMYMLAHQIKSINLRLLYINTKDELTKPITKRVTYEQMERTFLNTMHEYMEWLKIYEHHQFDKNHSIDGLTFPHNTYREGQYPFMGAIYQTFIRQEVLYASAPTGIGKTVGALYAALKSVKDSKEKIFYLTAKNAGKHIAVDTVRNLIKNGLKVKAITLNSKDNMCLREEVDCDPEICPFAKGFYNRLSVALKDIFEHDDVYDMKLIKDYATYHNICPHEFALEIANYADIIICDFNYAFDPRIRLIRFFEESNYIPKLLVDESHNLVDRSRSMYSSELSINDIYSLKAITDAMKPVTLKNPVQLLINVMESSIKNTDVKKSGFFIDTEIDESLLKAIRYVVNKCESFLADYKKHEHRKTIRESYFTLMQFLRVSEYFSKAFRYAIIDNKQQTTFNIICLDASHPIKEIIDTKASGTVFFSATLNPSKYYASLLTQNEGKYFDVPSPFEPKKLGLFIDVSTSTKYHDRPQSIDRIIDSLYAMLESKVGNYIIFFPSYKYLEMVLAKFDQINYETLIQTPNMSLKERNALLDNFRTPKKTSKIMFSVLGGSFSEGVDYIGDLLHGVMIVGVALPAYNKLNEIMKDYFFESGYDGFHYAYTYPGMNKVIQAVGRVIRTMEDRGVAILLDERYNRPLYQSLMPKHWSHAKYLEEDDYIQGFLDQFWNNK